MSGLWVCGESVYGSLTTDDRSMLTGCRIGVHYIFSLSCVFLMGANIWVSDPIKTNRAPFVTTSCVHDRSTSVTVVALLRDALQSS